MLWSDESRAQGGKIGRMGKKGVLGEMRGYYWQMNWKGDGVNKDPKLRSGKRRGRASYKLFPKSRYRMSQPL